MKVIALLSVAILAGCSLAPKPLVYPDTELPDPATINDIHDILAWEHDQLEYAPIAGWMTPGEILDHEVAGCIHFSILTMYLIHTYLGEESAFVAIHTPEKQGDHAAILYRGEYIETVYVGTDNAYPVFFSVGSTVMYTLEYDQTMMRAASRWW